MSDKPFNNSQTWAQSVITADSIYAQVKAALKNANVDLPLTPRRPDVRLIVNNISGKTQHFLNPGNHSKDNAEKISGDGDKTAAMVMLNGDTLEQQMANADKLVKKFSLDKDGLSKSFAAAIGTDKTEGLIAEAYGPAPFEGQSDQLVELNWKNNDGSTASVQPFKSKGCAYGARAATNEPVIRTELVFYVQGTSTVPEAIENEGMCIAVAEDWQTKVESTRPIVPSIAKDFYGAHYKDIPVVNVNPQGYVQSIELANGQIIAIQPHNMDTSKIGADTRLQTRMLNN